MEKENRCSFFRRKPANRYRPATTGDCGPTNPSSGNGNENKVKSNSPIGNQYSTPKPKVTRNPFINFLFEYRRKHTSLSITESAKEAARVWNSMDETEKAPYLASARAAPKNKRKTRIKKYEEEEESETSEQSTSVSRSRSRDKKKREKDRKSGKSNRY